MRDVEERRIDDLVVRIDRRLCVGFGDCVDAAPDAFALDEDGIAVFVEGAGGSVRERVIAACEACPVDALTVLDADGRQIVPAVP